MNIRIRKANMNDSKIANVFLTKLILDEKKYDSNINEKFIVQEFYEHVISNESSIMFIAEIDDKPIGYLYGFIENNGDIYINKVSKLDALYVEKEYRNNGVASKLINEFKNWSKEKNVKYIEVQVCNENKEAINIYNKNNFESTKSTLYTKIS